MALQFRDTRTGVVRTMLEPSEVKDANGGGHLGDWLAMHQRRTIQKMDESRRWQRVYEGTAATATGETITATATTVTNTATPASPTASAETVQHSRPAINDPKDAWVDYAVEAHGYDRDEAKSLRKDQLTELD